MARSMVRKAAMVALAASVSFAGTAVSQQPQVYGIGAPAAVGDLPPGAFRDSLLALEPRARARAMAMLQTSIVPAADFAFMRLNQFGDMYYVDPAPDEGVEDTADLVLPEGALTEADVFSLHSKPGASKILYIDFDGHTLIDTAWNSTSHSGQAVLDMRPFDVDGDYSSFSQAELDRIAESWRRVSEDFARYDVDVTTEEPPFTIGAGGRIEYGPNVGHNLITNQTDANGNWAVYSTGSCGCGGIAYYNGFGRSYYLPGLTFNESVSSNAQTISHETGHNLNLHHDGTSTSGYYSGHGSGETGWGPTMGAPFGKSLVTWSRNEYPDANNPEDDYTIISGFLPYRADDHADVVLADATPLVVTGDVNVVSTTRVTDPGWSDLANKGIIEDPNDYDLFRMSVGIGTIALTVEPANNDTFTGVDGANLDIQLRLLDSAGNVLQTSNPDLDLGASVNYAVGVAGDYYLEVTGVGRAGTGSSDYGHAEYTSVGQYYISGTVPPDVVATEPPVAPSEVLWQVVGNTSIELSWDDPIAAPEANEAGYRVFRSLNGVDFDLRATLPQDSEFFADNNLANGDYSYYLEVYNSASVVPDRSPTVGPITIDAPTVAVATSESTSLGSVVSGSYASTQDMPGAETLSESHSGGRPQNRVSYLDHRWFVTGVQPGLDMTLEFTASAADNTDGDSFAVSYSTDGASWMPVYTFMPGETQPITVGLPAGTIGTVTVRVVDTDRTPGKHSTDTISVSLIRVTSHGDPGDLPPTVTITAPSDGITVAGGTYLDFVATAEDDIDVGLSGSISWSSDIDGPLGIGASQNVQLSGGGPAVTHEVTASVIDSAGNVAEDSITVIVSNEPAAEFFGVGSLAGVGEPAGKGGKWSATVTVLVVDDLGNAVSDATVSGTWSGDASGGDSCTTLGDGSCTITKGGLKGNASSVTFSVSNIEGSLTYDSGLNIQTSVDIMAPP